MSSFQTYDPRTLHQKSQPKACEACYVAKVKCDTAPSHEICKNCNQHGTECRQRARKRKGEGTDSNPGLHEIASSNIDSGSAQSKTNTGKKRQRTDICAQPDAEVETTYNLTPVAPALQDVADTDLSAPLLFIGNQDTLVNSPSTIANAAISSVDKFHNSSYLSRSAILGSDFPNIDHSHVDQNVKQHKLSSTEWKVLELYGAFDLPELPLRQSLIEAFQEKCWTWMPVVDLPFQAPNDSSNKISLLPLQATLLAGALMRPGICDKATCDTYYYRVKALIHSGYERNPLNILAAMCLVQYYTPTAPKDVSVDTPRFWWSSALGIAQQIGLHRQPTRRGRDHGLRRRIWWTLYVRDSIMSSAHGRPRLLRLADSTMNPPSVDDFPDPNSLRARIFVAYVGITETMCDLCELLVNSDTPNADARDRIEQRVLAFVRGLPHGLRLYDDQDLQRPYNFELAQLHIPLLTTIIILYRPHSVFSLNPSNAVSVTAAYLGFRIFQAIEIREQTRFLSSTFSWYLLVTAIPHLSSLRIPALRTEANSALDAIEGVLTTLGTVRPSAATELQNVKAIRKALSDPEMLPARNSQPGHAPMYDSSQSDLVRELLGVYGPQALRNYDGVANAIDHVRDVPDGGPKNSTTADLDGMSGEYQRHSQHGTQNPTHVAAFDGELDIGGTLDSLFGTHFEQSMWMRNWIDELQHFPE